MSHWKKITLTRVLHYLFLFTVPFEALQMLFGPLQKLVAQDCHQDLGLQLGRNLSFRCHQSEIGSLGLFLGGLTLGEKDLLSAQADIPFVVLTTIPRLRCSHQKSPNHVKSTA